MSTLQSLLSWEAKEPGDNIVLHRVIKLISAHLPCGWKDWNVRIVSKEDLLGAEMDSQVLNKIRFAIPTVGLARAFSPECSSLPEKTYRNIKLKLLEWPLCVGLIIHPMSLAARVRGSAVQNELVIAAIADMKPLLKSREAASRELSAHSDQSEEDVVSTISSRSTLGNSKKPTRLDRLEQSQIELKYMMEQFIKSFQPDEKGSCSSKSDSSSESELDETHPEIYLPVSEPISIEEELGWAPTTRQQEPQMPTPDPLIAEQGIKCQQLGEKAFNQVRYAEAQKKLHASPVFGPLKVNHILTTFASTANQDHLARSDYTLGTITHGLLLQREALTNTLKELSNKHPTTRADIKHLLSADTPLRSYSDDLLQFVCGKRAEIIEQRRNSLLPRDEYQATLLSAIPPSTSHLFCEKQLAELLKQPSHQTFFRNPHKKPFQTRNYNTSASYRQSRPANRVSKTPKQFNRLRKPSAGKENEKPKRPISFKSRNQAQSSSRDKVSKAYTSYKKHRSS